MQGNKGSRKIYASRSASSDITLTKLYNSTFSSGDKILFKSGTSYNDQLDPKGTVLKEDPLLLIIRTHKARTELINS